MVSVIDRLTEEISGRFQQVHDLASKYAFLAPSNLLDNNYDCQLGKVDEDIEKRNSLPKGGDCSILWKLQEMTKPMDPLNF